MRIFLFLLLLLNGVSSSQAQRIDLEGDIHIFADSLTKFREEIKTSRDTPFIVSAYYLFAARAEALRESPEEATEYFVKGLQLAEEYKDPYFIVKFKGQIASYFMSVNLPESALKYLKELDQYYADAGENAERAHVRTTWAGVKSELNQYDSAFYHLQVAEEMTSDTFLLSIIEFNKGLNLFKQEQHIQAIPFFLKGLPLAEKSNWNIISPMALLLGECYLNTGQLSLAEEYLQKAIFYATEVNDVAVQKNAHCRLVDVLYQRGSLGEAYPHFEKCTALQDSVFRMEKAKEARELLIQYDQEKTQLELEKTQQENALNVQRVQQRNQLLLFLVFLAVLAGVIAILVYRTYRLRLRVSTEREEKQRQVHESSLKQLQAEQRYQQTLALIEGQEEERRRMGRDLHDSVGGYLAALRFQLDELKEQIGPVLRPLLTRSTHILSTAVHEVRTIARNAVPDPLIDQGLPSAIRNYVDSLFDKDSLTFRVLVSGDIHLSNEQTLVLFRMLQELIQNAVKHAEGDTIEIIMVALPSSYQFTVSDNGKGMDQTQIDPRRSAGMTSIQYRVDYLQGSWEIDTQAGSGTTVFITIPKETRPDQGKP